MTVECARAKFEFHSVQFQCNSGNLSVANCQISTLNFHVFARFEQRDWKSKHLYANTLRKRIASIVYETKLLSTYEIYEVSMVELRIWIPYVSDEYKYGILLLATLDIYYFEIWNIPCRCGRRCRRLSNFLRFSRRPATFIFRCWFFRFCEFRFNVSDRFFLFAITVVGVKNFHSPIHVGRSSNRPHAGRLRDGSCQLVFVLRNERNYKAILAICIYAYCEVLQTYAPFG